MPTNPVRPTELYTLIRRVLGDSPSDRQLARITELGWRSFLALKQGARASPRIGELERVATALDLDPAVVFEAARGTAATDLVRALRKPAALATLILPKAIGQRLSVDPFAPSVDRLGEGVMTVEFSGRVRSATPRLGELTGHTPSQLKRLGLWRLTIASQHDRIKADLARANDKGEFRAARWTLVRKDDKRVRVAVDGFRISGRSREPLGVQLTLRRA